MRAGSLSRFAGWLAVLVGCVALIVAVVLARLVSDGRGAMLASDDAFDRGDLAGATFHARRAASYYVPGAAHVTAAYERLKAVAVGSEARADFATARLAWSAMRRAALESGSWTQVRRADLDLANQSLARLSVRRDVDQAATRSEYEARLAELEARRLPSPDWVLGMGLALVTLAALWWRTRTLPAGGLSERLVRAAIAVGAGALWILSVWKA